MKGDDFPLELGPHELEMLAQAREHMILARALRHLGREREADSLDARADLIRGVRLR